jgi:cell division protein FtsN
VKVTWVQAVFIVAVSTGCASSRDTGTATVLGPRAGAPGDTTVVGRVTPEGRVVADTLTDGESDPARVERETVYAGVIASSSDEPTAVSDEPTAVGEDGPWRVQVYAVRDRGTADSTAARLGSGLDEPIRVDHEAGWYKVRVGSHASRAAAEPLRQLLASRGWRGAFVVRAP